MALRVLNKLICAYASLRRRLPSGKWGRVEETWFGYAVSFGPTASLEYEHRVIYTHGYDEGTEELFKFEEHVAEQIREIFRFSIT